MVPLLRVCLVLLVGILLLELSSQVFFAPHMPKISGELAVSRGGAHVKAPASKISTLGRELLSGARFQNTEHSPRQLIGGQGENVQAIIKKSSPSRSPPATALATRQELQPERQWLLDLQLEQEARDYQESLVSTNSPPSGSAMTEQDGLQLEQQRLLDQDAANYQESLQSTNRPEAEAEFTDQEELQLQRQRLVDEQLEQDATNYQESLEATNGPQASSAPTQHDGPQLEQQRLLDEEAANYERSLRSTNPPETKAGPETR